ncbi:MAG: lysophospholipid acyltransferase family protein [Proteobacteria bacterium]|jgi:KDO2-lipid IV(A) lauroyltransferase|nr:lysophospholipid acyltransferase family protein [Pseudomonadota bacterium]
MKRLLIEFGFLIIRLVSYLPMPITQFLGNIFGTLGYYIVKKRRNVGIKNLSLCFPDMTEQEKHKIIKQHFKYLLTSALEYGFLFFASREKIRKIVTIKNIEYVNKYYQKRPIILLCPHFIGLDLGASRLSQDFSGCSMYSEQKDYYLTQRLKNARVRFMKDRGGEVFPRNKGLRPVIKKLRAEKEMFYYLPDQDLGERDSIYVPFFAHPACATVNVLPKLVSLTDAVVIPLAVYRVNSHYEVEFSEAWDNYPSGDLEADVIRMNKFIEVAIQKNVAQYFWLHKRFKSQPNMVKGIIYQ